MSGRRLCCIIFISILMIRVSAAQDFSCPPLFRSAYNLDSNARLYGRLHIHHQVDSTYENGQLQSISTSVYNDSGFITNYSFYDATAPGWYDQSVLTYDQYGNCISAIRTFTHNGDTMLQMRRTVILDDTATYRYGYKIEYFTAVQHARDSLSEALELSYIETRANHIIRTWHPDHMVLYGKDSRKGTAINAWCYFFKGEDTLFCMHMRNDGPGSHDSLDYYIVIDPQTRALQRICDGRTIETKTWKDGKLAEHHRFEDSLSGLRVMKTRIYNEMDTISGPEVVIVRTDSMTMVVKGTSTPYLHYGDPPVYADSLVGIEPEEFPQFSSYFTYSVKHRLAEGRLQTDYFNPFYGTALPIFRLWTYADGTVYQMQELKVITHRKVW